MSGWFWRILRGLGLSVGSRAKNVQLVMWYMDRQDHRQEKLPAGYTLRPFQEGDQAAWSALLNRNNQLGRWDGERIEGELAGSLQRSGQFFVENGGRLVACAGVYDRQRNEEPCWEIGWIANDPSEVGKGLGRQVAVAAVRYALALPERPIYLLTDDHRLPALKTYFKIGFVPDLEHPTYVERWQLIFSQLGEGYSEYNCAFRRRVEGL